MGSYDKIGHAVKQSAKRNPRRAPVRLKPSLKLTKPLRLLRLNRSILSVPMLEVGSIQPAPAERRLAFFRVFLCGSFLATRFIVEGLRRRLLAI